MAYKQEAPFAVQVELVEGCNLRCGFCGLNGIRGREHNLKLMEHDTLASLCQQMQDASWNARVEFAMHGEPTLHPHAADMVRTAREHLPRAWLMMTSNGGGLVGSSCVAKVRALFDAGLNVLALDDYDGVRLVPKIRESLRQAEDLPPNLQLREYPEDPLGNPHRRGAPSTAVVSFVADISKVRKGDGTHSLLNNHAGSGAPLNDSQAGSRCAKPFRELSVRWDGSVALCCNDWRGAYKCGSVVSDGLLTVWNGAAMDAARRRLVQGQRDFGPCRGCDAVSYRVGLLPDKKGQVAMPRESQASRRALEEATAGAPYTAPVLRPWERQPAAAEG